MYRIGQGFDVHKLGGEGPITLCGVKIPNSQGLIGHSDADVAVHALMDALLGALALGDIGNWFPDTDQAYRGADSLKLLERILSSQELSGWHLGNLDITIIAEKPKMAPHVIEMRQNIARSFKCNPGLISVKATTTEKLGFCGRGEGIAATAVILLGRQ
ncbi:MAG: 2-C-methyl-D-erythritol 2,4-cyclodiphosphate synthase [Lentisphaerae bacterium GWF2_45_14]|nr:MAG: 2-C-methyl-D-erythritol 2,4-cyclodiphosphate synthase [Lentisphaerae bacterium GWF2_45_14]